MRRTVTFGELMLRLSPPGHERFLQSPRLQATFGGGEANVAVSLTSVVGAVVAYFALGDALELLPYALAVAAASFLYVAVADLIPGLHRRVDARTSIQQVALIVAGMAIIYFSHELAH